MWLVRVKCSIYAASAVPSDSQLAQATTSLLLPAVRDVALREQVDVGHSGDFSDLLLIASTAMASSSDTDMWRFFMQEFKRDSAGIPHCKCVDAKPALKCRYDIEQKRAQRLHQFVARAEQEERNQNHLRAIIAAKAALELIQGRGISYDLQQDTEPRIRLLLSDCYSKTGELDFALEVIEIAARKCRGAVSGRLGHCDNVAAQIWLKLAQLQVQLERVEEADGTLLQLMDARLSAVGSERDVISAVQEEAGMLLATIRSRHSGNGSLALDTPHAKIRTDTSQDVRLHVQRYSWRSLGDPVDHHLGEDSHIDGTVELLKDLSWAVLGWKIARVGLRQPTGRDRSMDQVAYKSGFVNTTF